MMNSTKIFLTSFFIFVLTAAAFSADRALVIGINKYKMVSETPGGVADAEAIAAFIERKYKFPHNSILILREGEATADSIKYQIENWLIKGTKPGDRVFLFYSGHGGQVDDDNGDEKDEKDELDEVLAPYDVNPGDQKTPPSNFIRDDEMNVFLVKLSGRRVVMAFDSCHSGTISRNLEPKSKFVALRNKFTSFETMRSITDQESYVPKDARSRDLTVVKEDFIDKRLNGIVVFSAAGSYQKAMWLADKSRGAFAYSFEKVQEGDNYPSVAELDARIRNYMDYLKKNKLVITEQVPEMEIISQTRLDNKPLFAEIPNTENWESSVLTSLHNPLADFQVNLNLGKNSYSVGDKLNYSVEIKGLAANEKAYLYILVFSVNPQGKRYVTSLFPTAIGNDFDNFLGNGVYGFPRTGKNGGEYETEAQEPGKDVFVAFVSKKKLNFGDRDEYTWEETYQRIGVNNLQKQVEELSRSWGNRPQLKGGDWQATSAVVYVR